MMLKDHLALWLLQGSRDLFQHAIFSQQQFSRFETNVKNKTSALLIKTLEYMPMECRESAASHLLWFAETCSDDSADSVELTSRDHRKCKAHYEAQEESSFWGMPCLPLLLTDDAGMYQRRVCYMEPLGRGKEAEVWRICDSQTGTELALKVFRRVVSIKKSSEKTMKKNTDSFEESISLLYPNSQFLLSYRDKCRLIRHATNYLEDQKVVYHEHCLVYELASMDLADLSNLYDGSLGEEFIACIGYKIFKGLWEIWQKGKLWMDCKPRNILIFNGMHPMLSDLSFLANHGEISWSPGMGTPGFRAPEYLKAARDGRKIYFTGAAVMFSYGASLFHLVFNRSPYGKEDNFADLHPTDGPMFRAWRTLSPELMDLLEGLLAVDPMRRYSPFEVAGHPFFEKNCKECKEDSAVEECCCAWEYPQMP